MPQLQLLLNYDIEYLDIPKTNKSIMSFKIQSNNSKLNQNLIGVVNQHELKQFNQHQDFNDVPNILSYNSLLLTNAQDLKKLQNAQITEKEFLSFQQWICLHYPNAVIEMNKSNHAQFEDLINTTDSRLGFDKLYAKASDSAEFLNLFSKEIKEKIISGELLLLNYSGINFEKYKDIDCPNSTHFKLTDLNDTCLYFTSTLAIPSYDTWTMGNVLLDVPKGIDNEFAYYLIALLEFQEKERRFFPDDEKNYEGLFSPFNREVFEREMSLIYQDRKGQTYGVGDLSVFKPTIDEKDCAQLYFKASRAENYETAMQMVKDFNEKFRMPEVIVSDFYLAERFLAKLENLYEKTNFDFTHGYNEVYREIKANINKIYFKYKLDSDLPLQEEVKPRTSKI